MAAVNPGERGVIAVQTGLLLFLYVFLYFPIFYIAYLSFMENMVWPFPPSFTWDWYARLQIMSDFHTGLWNSFLIGAGTAALSALFATAAGIGVLLDGAGWLGVATAAMLHLAASTASFSSGNTCQYGQLQDDVLTDPLEIVNGMIAVPQSPGLGVEVDRAKVERYQID